jgi:predicted permease
MLQVLTICLPVFAMIGFGALLRGVGFINEASHDFVSRFVYLFALPVIIFLAVARGRFADLFVPSVIMTALLAITVATAALWLMTRRLPARLSGPAVVSPFFANTAYLGIPLARNAYGDEGLRYAAIINAFMFPLMVMLAVTLLAANEGEGIRRWRRFRSAVLNPVVLAAAAGVLLSGAVDHFALGERVAASPVLSATVGVAVRTLEMFAQMALPLALIAVGASLRFESMRGHLLLMAGCAAGKLLLTPLLTLLACTLLFPQMPPAALGTTVLLMACPLAVTCYVIGREMDTDDDFIAGLLVMSTAAACVTIPFWLHILL